MESMSGGRYPYVQENGYSAKQSSTSSPNWGVLNEMLLRSAPLGEATNHFQTFWKRIANEFRIDKTCSDISVPEYRCYDDFIIQGLWLDALICDEDKLYFVDERGKQFTIYKFGGKICLTYDSNDCPAHQFDIPELQSTVCFIFPHVKFDSCDHRSILHQLAIHIENHPFLYSPELINLSKKFVWYMNHNEFIRSSNAHANAHSVHNADTTHLKHHSHLSLASIAAVPSRLVNSVTSFSMNTKIFETVQRCITFPIQFPVEISGAKISPPIVIKFLRHGSIPETMEERCQLAWHICATMATVGGEVSHETMVLLMTVLKDLKHVEFSLGQYEVSFGNQNKEKCYQKSFALLCNYLCDHFTGNSINIQRFYSGLGSEANKKSVHEISQLFTQNPNLTSIYIKEWSHAQRGIEEFASAIQHSSVPKIGFGFECNFYDGNNLLAEAVSKNGSIRELTTSGYIDMPYILMLIKNSALTTIEFNRFCFDIPEYSELQSMIKNNWNLTSIRFGSHPNSKLPADIDEHLKKNVGRTKLFQIYLQSRLLCEKVGLPRDVERIIGLILRTSNQQT